ncbi:MAG: FCD domain-containing protein [Xanthobacteraceae bacterium]|nr:MAG: FCD domain-containing protein [Xanthobacteraceae bacterium]
MIKGLMLDEGPPSLTRSFVDELREEILSGRQAPDARLHLQDLKHRYRISLSPIREGLAYLIAEGFVMPVGQRGYRVAPISRDGLAEIVDLRINLELAGLRASIARGDEMWELLLLTSYQRLRNFEQRRWNESDAGEFENRNRMFHRALIGACGSPLLIRFVEILSGMSDRYRRLFLKNHEPDRDVPKEHADIYGAALDRDADRACEALRRHITHVADNVLDLLKPASDAKPRLRARRNAGGAPADGRLAALAGIAALGLK